MPIKEQDTFMPKEQDKLTHATTMDWPTALFGVFAIAGVVAILVIIVLSPTVSCEG